MAINPLQGLNAQIPPVQPVQAPGQIPQVPPQPGQGAVPAPGQPEQQKKPDVWAAVFASIYQDELSKLGE